MVKATYWKSSTAWRSTVLLWMLNRYVGSIRRGRLWACAPKVISHMLGSGAALCYGCTGPHGSDKKLDCNEYIWRRSTAMLPSRCLPFEHASSWLQASVYSILASHLSMTLAPSWRFCRCPWSKDDRYSLKILIIFKKNNKKNISIRGYYLFNLFSFNVLICRYLFHCIQCQYFYLMV